MSELTLLQTLRTSAEAKRILEHDFDFYPVSPATKSSLFQLRDDISYELVGKDASGGEFVLCEGKSSSKRAMLYASSEGQAGIIAGSLERGLSIIIDLPSWRDCLKFSNGGQLAEMRRVVPLSESDLLEDRPTITSSRQALRKLFGLFQVSDLVRELHEAVTEMSPLYSVCGPDGWQLGPLFGRFTVMSNGAWRRRLAAGLGG
jgi:hypothetical protein